MLVELLCFVSFVTLPLTAIERRNIQVNNKQTTLETFEDTISEKDELNLEPVKVFPAANIPLEKVDKLRPFFVNIVKIVC